MQIKLTIALVAVGCALMSFAASAADMPADGTKNFSPPGTAPSYFTNETVPETARVANQATFTEVDEATTSEAGLTETERGGRHASGTRSTRHASGKSKGHGGSTHYTKGSSSKSTRSEAAPSSGTGSASAAKGSARSGTMAGPSKAGPTKHAKANIRQHAAAALAPAVTLYDVL